VFGPSSAPLYPELAIWLTTKLRVRTSSKRSIPRVGGREEEEGVATYTFVKI